MVPNRKEPRSRADQSRRKSVIHQKAHFFFYILLILPILLLDLSSVLVSFFTLICRSRLCAVAFFQPSLFSRLFHHLAILLFPTQHYL